jgi:hypothetical protein
MYWTDVWVGWSYSRSPPIIQRLKKFSAEAHRQTRYTRRGVLFELKTANQNLVWRNHGLHSFCPRQTHAF